MNEGGAYEDSDRDSNRERRKRINDAKKKKQEEEMFEKHLD